MLPMPDEYREHMFESTVAEVRRFIDSNPGFALGDIHSEGVTAQHQGSGTNFVLWGDHDGSSVIYKFFHPDWGANRYLNELACLRHFAPTGWTPAVHALVPESLIVMGCLPGRFMSDEAETLETDVRKRLSYELGEAVGAMIDLPLPEVEEGYSIVRDYDIIPWDADVQRAVSFYIGLCRRDRHLLPTGADLFYDQTLSLVESQLYLIPRQRWVIYHEDFHCFAHKGRLQGVFDVEMARVGTDLMQMERVFGQCGPGGLRWESVLEGYLAKTGRRLSEDDHVFMLAMALLYYHIRITRWGSPNTRSDWIAQYLPDLKEEARKYADYVDLRTFLPSL